MSVGEDGPNATPSGASFLSNAGRGGAGVFLYIKREQVVIVHSTMVLVHGIHKKTQKTPAADLALAQRRMREGT